MDFKVTIEEAKAAAEQADNVGGSYVNEPGAYKGKVTKAYFKKFKTGAGALQIEADVNKNGERKQLNISIFTITKNGISYYEKDGKKYPLPGMNQITGGLMPVTGNQVMPSVVNSKGEITYPCLIGAEVGFLVNIKKSNGIGSNSNKVYTNAELVAFYDPKTNKTGSEILNNTEAKKKQKIEEGLKIIDETRKISEQDPFVDKDPFAIDDINDNPFKNNHENESNEEIYENETSNENYEDDFFDQGE